MQNRLVKRGFVLLETIVVICVLCVMLVTIFTSFNTVLSKVKTNSKYDNTEYIFKTAIVRDILYESNTRLEDKTKNFTICSNFPLKDPCDSKYKNYDLEFLGVQAIYIMPYNASGVAATRGDEFLNLEPTTQKYVLGLDTKNGGSCRIIVAYSDENKAGKTSTKYLQYATLEYNCDGVK